MPQVYGEEDNAAGVVGRSSNADGVVGWSGAHAGVRGESAAEGRSGVVGMGPNGNGVSGMGNQTGVYGESRGDGPGVVGINNSPDGHGVGVLGQSTPHPDSVSLFGEATATATAVWGRSENGRAVVGWAHGNGTGVQAMSDDTALWAQTGSATGKAGVFFGRVDVYGDLTVTGSGNKSFKIDHPLDPQNRYLLHNAVESSERKNVYDGVETLDEDGAAWVDLPEWFEALNGDFRYQLTAVGGPAPNLHVAEEIYEHRFKIAGGEEGMKVCWHVTGSRKDPWAAANPFVVEQEKPQEERGRYLQPDLYGAPEEQSVMRALMGEHKLPQRMRQELPQPLQFPPTPTFGLEGDLLRQINELRQEIEGLRRGRVEDEQQRQIDDLRRQIEDLRRKR